MSLKSRFLKKFIPEPNSGCWLWTGAYEKQGYGHIGAGGRRGKTRAAHQVAYELFRGTVPEGFYVLHHCDVRECVNPDHLYIGTQKQNIHDAINRGRFADGERHGRSKLTLNEVIEIRRRLAIGESRNSLAAKFGVQYMAISDIARNKTWANADFQQ